MEEVFTLKKDVEYVELTGWRKWLAIAAIITAVSLFVGLVIGWWVTTGTAHIVVTVILVVVVFILWGGLAASGFIA